SDRPALLDSRSGSWGSAPAVGFGESRSPVLRELQRYRRSAAPDGPASVSPQLPASATPAVRPDTGSQIPSQPPLPDDSKPVRYLSRSVAGTSQPLASGAIMPAV